MGSGAIIAAAAAASAYAASSRRSAEDARRRAEESRRREEERRRREEDERRRRQKEEQRRREDEHRKKEADARKRRFNNKLKNSKQDSFDDIDFSLLQFTDKLVISQDSFPARIVSGKFETKFADGSYITYDTESIITKNYSTQYREEDFLARSLHLPNGVVRTYVRENYSDDKGFHLVREELPDGRMKIYDFHQNILFERDADGNYKCYEHFRNHDDVVLTEEGTKDGWTKRYEYDFEYEYESGKYVFTQTKLTFSDGKYQIFDDKQHLLEEVDGDTYRRYYPDDKNSLKEEKDSEGNIYKWSEHGQLLEETLADGTIYRWNEFEVMTFEKLPTGEETHWNNKGKMLFEKLSDGTCHKWTDKGVMIYELLPTGDERKWNDDGLQVYENLSNGDEHKWNSDGIMTYEKLSTGEVREWSDNGSKTREIFADGSETRWFPNTTKVSYKKKHDGSFKEFDELGRVIKEGTPKHSYVYRYYGDSKNVLDRRSFDALDIEEKSAYVHYDKKGNEDTEHYKTLKKIAKERIAKEDAISKKKGQKTILPKMSSIKKAIVYHQQLRKIAKDE